MSCDGLGSFIGFEGWCVGVGEFDGVPLIPGVPGCESAHRSTVDVSDATGNVPCIKILIVSCLVRSCELRVVYPPSCCLCDVLVF